MKRAFGMLVLGLVVSAGVQAATLEKSELTAEDLAAFNGLHWQAFTVDFETVPREVSFEVRLYKEGKIIDTSTARTSMDAVRVRKQRYCVVMGSPRDEEKKLRLMVSGPGINSFGWIKNEFTGGAAFIGLPQPKMDGKGRVPLGFALRPGVHVSRNPDLVPETGYLVLVLAVKAD